MLVAVATKPRSTSKTNGCDFFYNKKIRDNQKRIFF